MNNSQTVNANQGFEHTGEQVDGDKKFAGDTLFAFASEVVRRDAGTHKIWGA